MRGEAGGEALALGDAGEGDPEADMCVTDCPMSGPRGASSAEVRECPVVLCDSVATTTNGMDSSAAPPMTAAGSSLLALVIGAAATGCGSLGRRGCRDRNGWKGSVGATTFGSALWPVSSHSAGPEALATCARHLDHLPDGG
ncbi:hypothetical protein AB0D74_50005 [Streptomyces sp. NPDC048278]|uniref:hypothetical protein n=1 Tax=Streptomyces sp. NPDC048278 TaxID=3155809 RepID=UPI003421BFA8